MSSMTLFCNVFSIWFPYMSKQLSFFPPFLQCLARQLPVTQYTQASCPEADIGIFAVTLVVEAVCTAILVKLLALFQL